MRKIYNDKTYLENNPDWHAKDASFKAVRIIKLLKMIPGPIHRVAEIGCGSGEILVELNNQLPEEVLLFGFDISTDAINIAKTKETKRISIQLLDLVNEASGNYHFDVLLVIDVLEHVDNYFEFLDGIKEKGAYTVFHIPLDMSIWSLFREKMLIESKQRVGHIHNFTEDFVKSILEDHGFKILFQVYTPPLFDVKSKKAVIINGIRKMLFGINKRFASKSMGGYSILLLTENNSSQKQ